MSGVRIEEVLLVAIVVAPALVGAALLGARVVRISSSNAGWLGAAVLAVMAVVSWPVVVSGVSVGTPFVAGSELGLAAGGPAVLLLPTMLVVATLVLTVATSEPETSEPRFTGLMLLFTSAAALTVLATSLPALLVGWELMGVASYALIGYRWADPRRVGSGATAFLTTRGADLGLYLATAAALAGGTDLSLDSLAEMDGGWRDVAAAGVLVAGLGKAAQLPFSFWLARAMDGPSPASALLHSAAMVALGGYLLVRLSPLLEGTSWAGATTSWVGVTTAVLLGCVAIAQTDLKQLLAASTAAQLGFVVLAAGVGATAAGTTHLVAHAAVKSLLFLAAGAWLHALGTRRLFALTGALRLWPALGALSGAGLLALSGLPPLSLWATKDAVLAGVREESLPLYLCALLASALSVAYALVALVILARPRRPRHDIGLDEEQPGTRAVDARVPIALAPLALAGVVLGLLTLPQVLDRVPGRIPVAPGTSELVVSSALVVLVAVGTGTWVLRRWDRCDEQASASSPVTGLLGSWLHLERAAHTLIVRPTLRTAEAAARVDDRIIAGAASGAARLTIRAARSVARLEDRALSGAVARTASGTLRAAGSSARGDASIAGVVQGVARGARRGGRAVRRTSSSGQLHRYYLQLVGSLLVVLVLVSVVVLIESSR